MPSTFRTLILALLITFSFLAVSKVANGSDGQLPKGFSFVDPDEQYKGGNGFVCKFEKPAKEKSYFFKITKDKKWISQAKFENDVVAFKYANETKVTLEKISWRSFNLDRRNLKLNYKNSDTFADCKLVTISELKKLATQYLKNELKKNKI